VQAPDVPTIAEVTGIPDFDYPPEIGVLAPAGTPPGIISRLASGIARAARHPETVQRFTALGIDPVGNTPEAYAAQIRIDIEKYAKAVKISGAKTN
jgi:tripartite-type tricarboxylate transporter receptor subunit TctC